MHKKNKPKKNRTFTIPPAGVFFIFLSANLFLSYAPAGLELKLWAGLFGLVLPFFLVLQTAGPAVGPLGPRETFSLPPAWVWWAFACLAVVARFHRLTSLTAWPHYDEGMTGYFSMRLSQAWDGRLFYESSQTPPAYLWGLGIFFKIFGVSLGTLWFFPALLSVLTVPLFYFAARQFFSKSASLLGALWMAFSFWPLFTGRFSLMSALILPWECLAFYLTGKFLKASGSPRSLPWAFGLGSVVGLGFYTGLHWIAIAGLLAGTFFLSFKKLKNLFCFLVPLIIIPLPLVLAALHQGYGSYFRHLWAFDQPLPAGSQMRVSLSYIASLFWGLPPDLHTYQPVWGGFFNPLLTSLFFLGLAGLFMNRNRPENRWLGAALVFLALPGLITKECEPLRILPLLPLLLVLVVSGLQWVLAVIPGRHRLTVLAVFLTCSFGLDFYHLNIRYSGLWDSRDNWKGYAKSFERKKAFEILDKIQGELGPGNIFSNFTTGLCDQTLSVADYAFNAVENPAIPPEKVQWTALVTNVNYRPFLDKRFGPSQAFSLLGDLSPPDGGWMLWVVPVTRANRAAFDQWKRADESLQAFLDVNLSRAEGEPYLNVISSLAKTQLLSLGDPFLESIYWEKASELLVKEGFFRGENPDPRYLVYGTQVLGKAAAAIPAAHIYNHMGNLWLLRDNKPEAQKAFKLAVKAPLNLTDSAEFLPKE